MKAFAANDKEVARAIKLLGKSMRYVLENTGSSFTTLSKSWNTSKSIWIFKASVLQINSTVR